MSGRVTCWKPVLDGFDLVLGRGQIAERVLAAGARHGRRDRLIGGDVAERQGRVGVTTPPRDP